MKKCKFLPRVITTSVFWWDAASVISRDIRPARYSDESFHWYKSNALHRDDGPAMIDSNGTRYWCRHGLIVDGQ